ncbi:hypothetical protein PoB_006441600 [Plakobranchus ocellatus]|uniref:Uncharacterized protein n=1 Tax=Plakobranchus ocellatus TaxID=259542 RepID=A0AAV4D1F3_9GAST|nr:hypothetical protein PoB_006441600 [Plakobranchus ocellatus]
MFIFSSTKLERAPRLGDSPSTAGQARVSGLFQTGVSKTSVFFTVLTINKARPRVDPVFTRPLPGASDQHKHFRWMDVRPRMETPFPVLARSPQISWSRTTYNYKSCSTSAKPTCSAHVVFYHTHKNLHCEFNTRP